MGLILKEKGTEPFSGSAQVYGGNNLFRTTKTAHFPNISCTLALVCSGFRRLSPKNVGGIRVDRKKRRQMCKKWPLCSCIMRGTIDDCPQSEWAKYRERRP